MSKITSDGLTRSDTEYFVAVPIWQQWASKGWTFWAIGVFFPIDLAATQDRCLICRRFRSTYNTPVVRVIWLHRETDWRPLIVASLQLINWTQWTLTWLDLNINCSVTSAFVLVFFRYVNIVKKTYTVAIFDIVLLSSTLFSFYRAN